MSKRWRSGLRFLAILNVAFLCQSLYAQTAPVILRFDFPMPRIVKNVFTREGISYDSILVESLQKHGAPGVPVMPFKTVKFLIPQDSDVENIELICGKKITLDGRYKIEYGKRPVLILQRQISCGTEVL